MQYVWRTVYIQPKVYGIQYIAYGTWGPETWGPPFGSPIMRIIIFGVHFGSSYCGNAFMRILKLDMACRIWSIVHSTWDRMYKEPTSEYGAEYLVIM